MITKDSDLIEWNNSENFCPGDFIKYRGKTGTVLEQIHQYIKTDIPGAGWINIVTEGKNTVRGVPKYCSNCLHFGMDYSGVPSKCDKDNQVYECTHNCPNWVYGTWSMKIKRCE